MANPGRGRIANSNRLAIGSSSSSVNNRQPSASHNRPEAVTDRIAARAATGATAATAMWTWSHVTATGVARSR